MTKLTWNDVKSSNISSYAFEQSNLHIKFKSGTVYKYLDVEGELVDRFALAESKGKFLNSEIKKHYTYEKIDD